MKYRVIQQVKPWVVGGHQIRGKDTGLFLYHISKCMTNINEHVKEKYASFSTKAATIYGPYIINCQKNLTVTLD